MKILSLIVSSSIICLATGQVNNSAQNMLHKVFYHRGIEQGQLPGQTPIELGSLVLYFAQSPSIKQVVSSKKKSDQEELVFIVDNAQALTTEVQEMIRKVNALHSPVYSVNVEQIKKPTNSIKISITFNPSKVGMHYDVFDSISLQKGVTFRFFNQELLKELNTKSNKPVLNMATETRKKCIVIDCGHGGSDSGTIGFDIKEKDLVLAVGNKVADLLKKKGFLVVMTREKDVFVPLDQRTTYANTKQHADLFVSLHANFSSNAQASGIETFYLEKNLLKPCFSTLDSALCQCVSFMDEQRSKKSKLLAQCMHEHVLQEIAQAHMIVKDRKVKTSVSQVLLGTAMPAALIELGFLSNEHEAEVLKKSDHQCRLAQGICKGIMSYCENQA